MNRKHGVKRAKPAYWNSGIDFETDEEYIPSAKIKSEETSLKPIFKVRPNLKFVESIKEKTEDFPVIELNIEIKKVAKIHLRKKR